MNNNNALPLRTVYHTDDKNFNPNYTKNNLFVGKWILLEEKTYLVSAGTNLVGKSYTGSNTHTLTGSEMPSHRHQSYLFDDQPNQTGTASGSHHRLFYNGFIASSVGGTPNQRFKGAWVNGGESNLGTIVGETNLVGSGQAHNNMPRSYAVYIWIRVS